MCAGHSTPLPRAGCDPAYSLKPDTLGGKHPAAPRRCRPGACHVGVSGYGGQKFIEDSYGCIRAIADAAAVANPVLIHSVDGGVNFRQRPRSSSGRVSPSCRRNHRLRDHGARENVPKLREAALKGL
jgi:hypothetical protein